MTKYVSGCPLILLLMCCPRLSMAEPPALTSFGSLPLHFEPNQGQTDSRVRFLARAPGYSVLLMSTETIIRPSGTKEELRIGLVDAARFPHISSEKVLEGRVNYFFGRDRSRWRTGIRTFGQIRYEEVYPGIDLVYYGNQSELEYDFVVAPGSEPAWIRMRFQGSGQVTVDETGDLRTETGTVRWRKPIAYQTIAGDRRDVAAAYTLGPDGIVGFTVASYDRSRPLVIDPYLVYATLTGGNGNADIGRAVCVDGSGNAYVVGATSSVDFPVVGGLAGGLSGSNDVFVMKVNSSGTALIYATYIGGSQDDQGYAAALDRANNLYVVGDTLSADFPTVGAVQPLLGGNYDAFAIKLDGNGNALLYSTYQGGSGEDRGRAVALDPTDNSAYLTGYTLSANFPTVAALKPTISGSTDGYLVKLSAAGSSRAFSTYLGGTLVDQVNAVAANATGVYVTGETTSTDYPNDGTVQAAFGGTRDCFVTKYNSAGNARIYSTYVGGTGTDRCLGIAVDSVNAAYITGNTTSATTFPITLAAVQSTFGGSSDAFVSKISPTGNSLVYSTFIGSARADSGNAISVDGFGNAYVTGYTNGNLPTVNAIQQGKSGGDKIVLKSLDGGSIWTASDFGLAITPLNAFIVDPVTPSTVYIGGAGNIYKSTNSGSSWISAFSGASGTVQAMAISASFPATLYAAVNGNLFKSINSANAWTVMAGGLPAGDKNFQAAAVDPTDVNTVYAGLTSSGVYKTTDGGNTWIAMNAGITNTSSRDIVIDPGTPQTLYLATTGGIFKSTNGGTSWSLSNTGLSSTVVTDLAISQSNPTVLYAVTGGVINKSTNSGASWSRTSTGISGQVTRVTVSPNDPNTAYAGTVENGIFKTTDGGASWNPTGAGFGDTTARQLAVNPATPATIYAAMEVTRDAFVAKLNSTGSAYVYLTHFGGRWTDEGLGIAADAGGNAYITGYTDSISFPATPGSVRSDLHGGRDLIVAKLADSMPACSYSLVTDNSYYSNFLNGAGAGNVRVIAPSGCAWTALANDSWLSILEGTSGSGVGVVTYRVAPNSSASRTGLLTIAGQTLTIHQAGSSCTYSVTDASETFPLAGGNLTFNLITQTGCPWIVDNNQDWVTFNTPLTGTGNSVVSYSVQPNTGKFSRTGTLTIAGITHTVSQTGTCGFAISPASQVFEGAGGSGSVNVTAAPGCLWGATPSTGFITITSGVTGTGNGSVTFTVDANSDATTRFGSFSVGGLTVSVTQNGAGCSFALNSTSANVAASSSVGNFTVTTAGGCTRAALSSAPWLTITSGAAGNGNGTINYLVSANLTAAARQATISGIGGHTFTVDQALGPVTIAPAVGTATPAAGNFETRTFTLTFTDANGWADLGVVDVLINNFLDGRNACYVAFVPSGPASGSLYLVDDAGNAAGPYAGMLLPSNSVVQNSQCVITGQGSSVTGSGNTLTLNLQITFKQPFAGNRLIYMAAQDLTPVNTGWQAMAVWNVPGGVPPSGPAVSGMSPARTTTAANTYTFTFTDSNGFGDLSVMNVLVNNFIDGRQACYLAILPSGASAGTVLLVDDAGNAAGPFAGGFVTGAGTAANNQCTVNGSSSSISGSGNILTLTLNITFNHAFAGNRVFYVAARNNTGGNTDWQAIGTATVP